MTTSRRSFLRYLGLGAGAAAAAPVVAKAAMAVDGIIRLTNPTEA